MTKRHQRVCARQRTRGRPPRHPASCSVSTCNSTARFGNVPQKAHRRALAEAATARPRSASVPASAASCRNTISDTAASRSSTSSRTPSPAPEARRRRLAHAGKSATGVAGELGRDRRAGAFRSGSRAHESSPTARRGVPARAPSASFEVTLTGRQFEVTAVSDGHRSAREAAAPARRRGKRSETTTARSTS